VNQLKVTKLKAEETCRSYWKRIHISWGTEPEKNAFWSWFYW